MFLGIFVKVEIFDISISGKLLCYQMSCKIPVHRPELLVIQNQDGTHLLRSWDKISNVIKSEEDA